MTVREFVSRDDIVPVAAPISADAVRSVRFTRVRGAYRAAEVDAFLARVAEALEQLESEKAALLGDSAGAGALLLLHAAEQVASATVEEASRAAATVLQAADRRLAGADSAVRRAVQACERAMDSVETLSANLSLTRTELSMLSDAVEASPRLDPNATPAGAKLDATGKDLVGGRI